MRRKGNASSSDFYDVLSLRHTQFQMTISTVCPSNEAMGAYAPFLENML